MAPSTASPIAQSPAESKENVVSRGFTTFVLAFLALLPPVTIAVVSAYSGTAAHLLTRDPTSVAKLNPLTGVLSNLGCLVWGASAAVWLFCATLHRQRNATQKFRFALSSGLLSAYLTFDDLFQFHDVLARDYFGIPENAVYAALVIAVGFYLFVFRGLLLKSDGMLLLFSFALLGWSMSVDAIFERWLLSLGHWLVFLEDAIKWLGIVAWCVFCVVRCRADLLNEPMHHRDKVSVSSGKDPLETLVGAEERR
jgi:hypothetical protein